MTNQKLKFWGWSYENDVLSPEELNWAESRWAKAYGVDSFDVTPTPTAEEITLRPSRLNIPTSLSEVCTTDHYERLLHSYGHSFTDAVRKFARDFSNPPDVVAYPRNEQEVIDVLDWCYSQNAVVIPFGGGTSVVGGVEPPKNYERIVTMDMRRMDKVLEVDPISETALIQAGAAGSVLEQQLKPHGLTLRHFPQSFQFSTLGGWIATRAGGHFATLYTHIDDLVESVRAVTPIGVTESRRLPGSGAGPSPDRLWLGSEGILGVITQAWVRLRKPPTFRASTNVRFRDMFAAADAVRAISQANLYPANCRVLDPTEAAVNGAGNGQEAILVLTFESAHHPLDAWMKLALEICGDYGGEYDKELLGKEESHRTGAAGQWRNSFLRMPWYREHTVPRGIISDTFETAITWERFPQLYHEAREATQQAIKEATGRTGTVSCRFTHVYPDGPAPYFSFSCLGDKSRLLDQFWIIKKAASDAIIKNGGTITHHHAVGRDHRPWYDQQRPEIFAQALRTAKSTLDPKGLLNPGVLIDPM